jgi:hypothetical protein
MCLVSGRWDVTVYLAKLHAEVTYLTSVLGVDTYPTRAMALQAGILLGRQDVDRREE